VFETRDEIANDDKAIHIFMGDGAEFITRTDPRFDSQGIDDELVSIKQIDTIGKVCVDFLGELFSPIADKCIGYHDGNHEKKYNRFNDDNVTMAVMKRAGIDIDLYNPGQAMTKIIFTDKSRHACSMVIESGHGVQAGRMDGAKINRMKQALAYFRCDLMLRGHSHSLFTSPADWLEPNATHTKLTSHRGYVSHTGSYMRTYEQDTDCYGEDFDYPPTSIGCPVFTLRASRDGVTIKATT
jgi:hypothetical protein